MTLTRLMTRRATVAILLAVAALGGYLGQTLFAQGADDCPPGGGDGGFLSDGISTEICYDWGDAPDPPYPTLAYNGGANHYVWQGMPTYLGQAVDTEIDGQPHPLALGADNTGDDEDGVHFPNPFVPGQQTTIEVTANSIGLLDAWIDFNGDGTWGVDEQVFASFLLAPGLNQLPVNVPAGALPPTLFARFRFSSAGNLLPYGSAADGEVEDYEILSSCLDVGDTVYRDVDHNGVYDVGTDDPIDGATVELWQLHLIALGVLQWKLEATDVTDANGQYQHCIVPPGQQLALLVRNAGIVYPSVKYVKYDPANLIDHDSTFSNLQQAIEWPLLPDNPSSQTEMFSLPPGHPDPDLTIDSGFECEDPDKEIMLVVDVSGSMNTSEGERLRQVKDASRYLVDQMQDGGGDQVGVVVFADDAWLKQPLTNDKGLVQSAIDSIVIGDGGTGTYTNLADGIQTATNAFPFPPTPNKPRIMLVISDGGANVGGGSPGARAAAAAAQLANIRIMAISWSSSSKALMAQIVSGPEDYASASGSMDVKIQMNLIVRAMCGSFGVGTIPCTGPSSVYLRVNSGESVTSGEDDRWTVDGSPAKVVTSPPSPWLPALPNSQWICRAAAEGGRVRVRTPRVGSGQEPR